MNQPYIYSFVVVVVGAWVSWILYPAALGGRVWAAARSSVDFGGISNRQGFITSG
jgi:hypothetical protein